MVKGLATFGDYFADYLDNYIIIGGTACDMIIDDAGFTPRATRDIDIILIVEALSTAFVQRFWLFVQEGNYQRNEKRTDGNSHYRFTNPGNKAFPYQVELFSRVPDQVVLEEPAHLTPIPADDDLSSLSAILLNDVYYHYIIARSQHKNNLRLAKTDALVCMKARAFLDMTERKEQGQPVDEKNIRKHKADVFRLAALLTAGDSFELPASIQADMQNFADAVANHLPDKAIFKEMGLGQVDVAALFQQLLKNFKLNGH